MKRWVNVSLLGWSVRKPAGVRREAVRYLVILIEFYFEPVVFGFEPCPGDVKDRFDDKSISFSTRPELGKDILGDFVLPFSVLSMAERRLVI